MQERWPALALAGALTSVGHDEPYEEALAGARELRARRGEPIGERRRSVNGEVIVVDDVASEFAERVVEAFHTRPGESFSLGLSGGGTARRCYERLAADGADQIDWWQVDVYWGDERCVPPDDPDSNERLVREALLERVGAANAVYPMRCDEGPDAYQQRVAAAGRFDLVHLGLGPDGHTASLFPDSSALDADPGRLVVMNEDPLGRNPHRRMTLTYSGIARARLVIFTVAGEAKREAFARVRAGDQTCPAARVRADRIVWLVDPAAAGRGLDRRQATFTSCFMPRVKWRSPSLTSSSSVVPLPKPHTKR